MANKKIFIFLLLVVGNLILMGFYYTRGNALAYHNRSPTCTQPTIHKSKRTILQIVSSNYSTHLAVVQVSEIVRIYKKSRNAFRGPSSRSIDRAGKSRNNSLDAQSIILKSKDRNQTVLSNLTFAQPSANVSRQDSGSRIKREAESDVAPTIVVAMALGITSVSLKPTMNRKVMVAKFPAFSQLLPTFCKTASCGFIYRFYMAHDVDDPFFVRPKQKDMFVAAFKDHVAKLCPKGLAVDVTIIRCYHSRKPAWAQNDAVYEAYLDGADYFYRVNDDSNFVTPKWTEIFVDTLGRMEPSNVGVVGPNHQGGAMDILTYDFTHRTHMEIFGFHYPRLFTDWTGDTWITRVYKPGRVTRVMDVHLVHSQVLGRRYDYHSRGKQLPDRLIMDKSTLNKYIQRKEELSTLPKADGTKVIAMSLYGSNYNYTNGAIRNAQLWALHFSDWNIRIFVPHPSTCSKELVVPSRIQKSLIQNGAQVLYVNVTSAKISLKHMNLLVALDKKVERFLIRDPNLRLGEREAMVIKDWVAGGVAKSTFHCIRDHMTQYSLPLVPGLWGSVRSNFIERLGGGESIVPFLEAVHRRDLAYFKERHKQLEVVDETSWTLEHILWQLFSSVATCHDSNCDDDDALVFPGSVHIQQRANISWNYIGEKFDGFGTVDSEENHIDPRCRA